MSLFGGSKSKSSSSSATTGSQTQLGDAVSINVGGGKKSHTNISIQKVDFNSVNRAFALADKTLDDHKDILRYADKLSTKTLDSAVDFSGQTLQAATELSGQIIEAGKYQAGATERIAEAFQAFVDEQNNPNEKNQMLLIVGAVGVLAVMVYMVAK